MLALAAVETPAAADLPSEVFPILAEAEVAAASVEEPRFTFEGLEGDRGRLARAFENLRQAGLVLENLSVSFHDTTGPCMGNLGLHRFTERSHEVLICNLDQARRGATLMHELAHVWVAQNITGQLRQDFLAARGLDRWHGGDIEWGERGTEHAAEVLAWGTSDHPCWVVPRAEIGDRDVSVLAQHFQLLTGRAPSCDADAPPPRSDRDRQVIE